MKNGEFHLSLYCEIVLQSDKKLWDYYRNILRTFIYFITVTKYANNAMFEIIILSKCLFHIFQLSY